jgi:AraC-like DNA-binding protein
LLPQAKGQTAGRSLGASRPYHAAMPRDDELQAISRPDGDPAPPPFRVVFERLHRVQRKASHWVSAHVHRHAEIMLPIHGSYRALVNRVPIEAPAGGAMLVAPGDRHEDLCDRPVGFLSASIRLEPGPTPTSSRPLLDATAPPGARIVSQAPEVHAVAERLFREGHARDACAARVQDALAAELLWRLIARLPRNALTADLLPTVERDDFAAAFAAACARHLHGRPGAATLARELGMAERTLTSHCRDHLGASPLRLFRKRQMEHARYLLAGGMSVAAAAEHLGFANPFHFSAVFRRVHGRPPSHAGIGMPPAGAGMATPPDPRVASPS